MGASVLSGDGESLSSLTPDQQLIPLKNKKKKTPDTLIIREELIQEPVNSGKRANEYSIPDVKKLVQKKHLHRLKIS